MNLHHIIHEEFESITTNKYFKDLKIELGKFNSDEDLLRNGGLSMELLDRLAYGFTDEDIKTLHPNVLNIRWKDDLENVKYEIKKSGLSPKIWASKINLSEPIDVSFLKNKRGENKFYIEDGHHRFMAAKILNKILNINLEIKINPIKELSDMGYDEFHRYLFKLYRN